MKQITPERKLELVKNMKDLCNVLVRRVVSFNYKGQGEQDAEKMRQDFTDVIRIIGEHSEMQRKLNGRWIPCSERLPEDGKEVLICDNRKTVSKAWYDSDMHKYCIADSDYYYNELDVTHWMHLPEPPEV